MYLSIIVVLWNNFLLKSTVAYVSLECVEVSEILYRIVWSSWLMKSVMCALAESGAAWERLGARNK